MIRMTKIGLILASFLAASQANALSITGVTADPEATLASAWLGASSGITVIDSTISYVGDTGIPQSGTYTGFNLTSSDPAKPNISLGDGIVLTSGTALFPMTNTLPSFSTETGTGSNSWIDFVSGQTSYDANSLSFNFTVDAGMTSISTSFVYGSEEYPEWASLYNDGFAFVVDGVNYAKFPDGSWVSLTSLASNNNMIDNFNNPGDTFNGTPNPAYNIEYDGITRALRVTGLLNPGLTTHTLEIVIADTGDQVWDSGVFLASLSAGHAAEGEEGIHREHEDNIPAIPEPETYAMLLAGLGLLGFTARRRKQKSA